MKFFSLFFLLTCSSLIVSGQASQHVYGRGSGNKIIGAPDGGFFVTGEMYANTNGRSFVMKFDSAATLTGLKTYRNLLEFYSYGNDITEIPGEGFLLTGLMFHDTISNDEISLTKCDYNGNQIWSKTFGNPLQNDEAKSTVITSNGYLLGAYTSGYGPGGEDFLLIKTDTSGNIVWSKNYGTARNEHGLFVLPYQNGYVFGGNCETASGETDISLLYLDSAGSIINNLQIIAPADQELFSMDISGDGGIILAASTGNGQINIQSVFIKITSTGNIAWSNTLTDNYSRPQWIHDYVDGIIATGTIYTQTQKENSFIIRIDSFGNITGQDFFGDSSGCQIKSSIRSGDTLINTGCFIKPGNQDASIYLNKYMTNDSACNHFISNFTLHPFIISLGNPVWQTDQPLISKTDAVVVVTDAFTTDSTLCDFNPYTNEFFFNKNISVSPNPANDRFIITFGEINTEMLISIFDMNGKFIRKEKTFNKETRIDTSELSAGVYSIEIKNDRNRTIKKLVKQ